MQSKLNGQLKVEVPDSEVVPQAKRRQFSAEYKVRIVEEADHVFAYPVISKTRSV